MLCGLQRHSSETRSHCHFERVHLSPDVDSTPKHYIIHLHSVCHVQQQFETVLKN